VGFPQAASEAGAPEPTGSGRRTVELPPLAEAWLARLATERGYSPRTLDGYRHDLGALARLADGRPWAVLGEADVRRWVAGRSRGGAAPRSIARALSAWRGFFDWLAERGELAANPARAVRAPRSGKRLPKALSPDQALSLVAGTAPQAPSGRAGDAFERARDRAMLELFYSSGLRLSELTGLDARYVDDGGYRSASWLDLREAEVTVLGKGGKRRTVPVGRHALDALRDWLDERQRWLALHPAADGRPLFVSALGRRLANRTVQVRLKRLAQLRGVPADVHPHVLQSSGDLRAVQELLGHASIATTQVYTSLDFQRLARVYDAAHPRARRR
jgi:integrase/recombinase XerC